MNTRRQTLVENIPARNSEWATSSFGLQAAVEKERSGFDRFITALTLGAFLLSSLVGCQGLLSLPELRLQSPEKTAKDEDDSDDFETKIQTPLIGDYVTFAGLNLVTLEGVGLVTGLNGTGDDPPPSRYRTQILQEMKRRGIRNPNEILSSPNTTLVVVRAYLPPLVRKGEHFDVEVRVPEGSETTSLRGGWLLETYLSEQAIVPGQGVLKGHTLAKAKGPILISTGEDGDSVSLAGLLRRGRVLGGGVSLTNRDLTIYLRSDFRSVRNSRRIAYRISERFHSYTSSGVKVPMAEAKTDQTILLRVPKRYKDNYPRYLQVVRNIAFRETPVARRLRMERLETELNRPETAEKAALQLEAIGKESVPILKRALDNQDLEVRFHAAMALAYLNESEGIPVLAKAALEEPAFRVYALAAMAATEDADAIMHLRELLNAQTDENGNVYDSVELRYGAFRALWTIDPDDPAIRGESLNGQFYLHVLHTTGQPIVHLTHRRRPEVVLFGADQRFLPPLFLKAGNDIIVTAQPGADTVRLARFEPGQPDRKRTVSTRIADVIRAAVELGASYPDVAQMLIEADKQHNLPGRLAIDALPRANRRYVRGNGRKRSRHHLMAEPNLFLGGPPIEATPEARHARIEQQAKERKKARKKAEKKDASSERSNEVSSKGRSGQAAGERKQEVVGGADAGNKQKADSNVGEATLVDVRTTTDNGETERRSSKWNLFGWLKKKQQ